MNCKLLRFFDVFQQSFFLVRQFSAYDFFKKFVECGADLFSFAAECKQISAVDGEVTERKTLLLRKDALGKSLQFIVIWQAESIVGVLRAAVCAL